ncbi:MAG: threonine/serine dehydratase [Tropicimonas sp.]|uniref:threonine ammonia-lyase n=1 Tax=Tropicimonas sp. TaxID=2067044 RepID=UPI003A868361
MTDTMQINLDIIPTFADVLAAAERMAEHAVHTPLLENARLNELTGGRVFLKMESLQRTGAFKFRGAVARLSQLADEGVGAVIAYSTGNHGQAIATAARIFGLEATIVMPSDAPKSKVARAEAAGAQIRFYDRRTESREEIAAQICAEKGGVIVPPGDDPGIIAGQGTAALEALRDLAARGYAADFLVTPCGGGGLAAGCATVLREISASTALYAAEPAAYNDTQLSLAARKRVEVPDRSARSICDALLAPIPAELPFKINVGALAGVVTATDDEVRRAMRFALDELKVLVEPGGAVALAAVLAGRPDLRGKTAVVLCTGGNVDADIVAELF